MYTLAVAVPSTCCPALLAEVENKDVLNDDLEDDLKVLLSSYKLPRFCLKVFPDYWPIPQPSAQSQGGEEVSLCSWRIGYPGGLGVISAMMTYRKFSELNLGFFFTQNTMQ